MIKIEKILKKYPKNEYYTDFKKSQQIILVWVISSPWTPLGGLDLPIPGA